MKNICIVLLVLAFGVVGAVPSAETPEAVESTSLAAHAPQISEAADLDTTQVDSDLMLSAETEQPGLAPVCTKFWVPSEPLCTDNACANRGCGAVILYDPWCVCYCGHESEP